MTMNVEMDVGVVVAGLTTRQTETILKLGRTPRRAIDFFSDVAKRLMSSTGKRPPLVRRLKQDGDYRYFLNDGGLLVKSHLEVMRDA